MFSLDLVILTECLASTDIALSSNLYDGPSPRTRISFYQLSVCTDKLFPTPIIITFLPNSLVIEKFECVSNAIHNCYIHIYQN